MSLATPPSSALRRVLRDERRPIVVSAVFGVAHQTCEILVPVVIGAAVDHAIEPSDRGQLALWLAVLAGLFVVLNLSYRFQFLIGSAAVFRSEHELRTSLCARLLAPEGAFLDDAGFARTGSLVAVAGVDAQRVSVVVRAVSTLCGAIAAFAVAAIFLFGVSFALGVLVLVGSPLVAWALHLIAAPLQRRSADEQARAGHAASVATDLVTGARVIEGLGVRRAASERYASVSAESLAATLRAATSSSALEGANMLISGLFLALVAFVAGRDAVAGAISVGELIAAVGVAQFLIGPIERVGYVTGALARCRASAARVDTVLAAPPLVHGGTTSPPGAPGGAVTVETIGLDVRAGELLGVAAASPEEAAGVVDALAGRSADGTVLDGIALADLPLEAARRLVLVADHDAHLFAGTIGENVGAIAQPDDDVLRLSGVGEVLDAVPGGLGARIGADGTTLSGGQRQRVALARALAADSPVLVLHEPTTAVDAATEAAIADGIRVLREGRTTIMVTTSPALLAACDEVAVVAGGAVVARGPHDELAADPSYRDLVTG